MTSSGYTQALRPVLRNEILLVLGVSLGMSATYSIVSFVAKLTATTPLAGQTTALNPSLAPGRPWLDLIYQLLDVFFDVVPVLLVIHLLHRDRTDPLGTLGLDRRRPMLDLGAGATLAAIIGIPGLGLYLAARWLGLNTTVAAANLGDVWWAGPVLVLAAIQNAVTEEIVVVGYVLTRLEDDLDWRAGRAVAASALLRGTYHLYQGIGGFVGNIIMGVFFAMFFRRTRRVMPLIVAHTILDVVAFLGYAWLRDRVQFL